MHTTNATRQWHRTPLQTLALMAVSAVLFVAIPVGAAHADDMRPSNTSLDCTTNAISAGGMTSCTVTVRDPMVGKNRPTGTVSFSSSPATAIPLGGDCTLVALNNNASSCTTDLLYISPGKQLLTATYTAADGVHTGSSSTTRKVTVAAAASPVVVSNQAGVATVTTPTHFDVYAAGCMLGGHPAYWGEYVSQGSGSDPLVSPNGKAFEMPANADGSAEVHWFPSDSTSNGVWNARWYCAATSPTSVSDPAIHWIGGMSSTTIAFPTA